MSLKKLSEQRCFGGRQLRFSHDSSATQTPMSFSVFLPPQSGPRPVLWYLSGLTCDDQNAVTKSGFQRVAAELGLIVVCPDTSPRGATLPGEDDDWDFGTGAGFYLDATAAPFSTHYKMESYIQQELQSLICSEFSVQKSSQGIFGHSMGGHGALVLALRHPDLYRSVSAFAPICAPSQVPWGHKAFGGYLRTQGEWAAYDTTALIAQGKRCAPILIDQGSDDSFLQSQLHPELLQAECKRSGQPLELRMQEGYDHSYYFIASFMEDHLCHHAAGLLDS